MFFFHLPLIHYYILALSNLPHCTIDVPNDVSHTDQPQADIDSKDGGVGAYCCQRHDAR